MRTREKETYSIQSVDKALDVLEALSEEEHDVCLTQLSERLGMNKVRVFRLLATFERRGYVEQEQGSSRYRLGVSAYEISQKFLSRMGLLSKARPVMERLVHQCGETAYLVVRRNDEALFLDMVDNAQQVKVIPLVGRRFPLDATAAGRVLLAFGGTSRQSRRRGNGTPVQAALAENWATIRLQGYCANFSDIGGGTASVAVPLFNRQGEIVGVLALVGPDFRMPREKVEGEMLPWLKDAAEVISSKLGYMGHLLDENRSRD